MASKTPDSFFQRLTRLFQSGPSVQRRVKGYDPQNVLGNQMQHGNLTYRTSAPFGFGKDSSQLGGMGSYGIVDRISRYSDFLSMEYCLSGDTKIPTPYGYKTLKQLSEEYGLDKEFLVYSYDVNTMRIVPSHAKQARKTRTDHAWEIIFDNGKSIIGTANHRLLKRDGTFCQIENLTVGDAMMPFDRKLFSFDKNKIYRITQQSKKAIRDNLETGRKDITFARILEVCDKIGFDIDKICLAFDAEPKLIESHLEKFGYRDFNIFAKSYTVNPALIKGMKKETKITFDNICKNYGPRTSYKDIISKLPGSNATMISKKIREYGFQEWSIFKKFYSDIKIKEIKYHGVIDLYDMTVDGHKNFATDSVISHNTPEIASALDIYCLAGNMEIPMFDGKTSTVEELYLSKKENFYVQSFDIENMKAVPGLCKKVIKTGENQKIFKINLQDKSYLRLTENHLVLSLINNELVYVKVKELEPYWSILAGAQYYNKKVISIEEDGQEDVYDLQVEKYHNFAAGINGGYTIIHNSDEMVGGDDRGKCFHVYSDNTQIKRALDELFYDVVNVEFNLRPWARNLVKFGDSFIVLEVIPDLGIVNVMPVPVAEIEREEGYNREDPYAVRFKWITRGNKYLENWQVCHFRILSNDLHGQYGTSVLESSRSIWRKLLLLEDAMLTYRVVRSPERRVFYIDVGNVPPNDVEAYMEAAKSTMKSNGTVDRQTGREDLRYNAQSIMDDFYIPVRGQNQGTRIESLAGGVHNSAVEDVEYMQQKLFAALKIPKPYINFDENISAKAALSQLDIRLSRTVQAYQKILIAELNKMAMIHLYVKGFDGPDLINFELKLSNPSSVALQQKLELWAVKFDIGGTAKETRLVDENWIQRNILELTNEEITQIEKGLRKDQIRIKELEDLELTKPDKSLAPRTTDIFDPSSYDVPGASVPKLPASNANQAPISGNDNSDGSKPSPREVVLSKQRENGINQTSELDIKKAPIKATPFLTRYKKNKSRREGISTGTAGAVMPDLSAMLSQQNKYTKDVYGKLQESNTSDDRLSLLESIMPDEVKIRTLKDISPDRFNLRIDPILTNNMRSIFKNLDVYLNEHPGNKKNLLTENTLNTLNLDDLTIETDGEDLLLEIADKNLIKNDDTVIEKVKEKSLTDILSDDDEI